MATSHTCKNTHRHIFTMDKYMLYLFISINYAQLKSFDGVLLYYAFRFLPSQINRPTIFLLRNLKFCHRLFREHRQTRLTLYRCFYNIIVIDCFSTSNLENSILRKTHGTGCKEQIYFKEILNSLELCSLHSVADLNIHRCPAETLLNAWYLDLSPVNYDLTEIDVLCCNQLDTLQWSVQ